MFSARSHQTSPGVERAVAKFQFVLFESTADFEKFLADLDDWRERGGALRLQAQKNAGCFQYRSFPLAVGAEKQIERGTDIDRYAFETTEIAQPQIRQHLGKFSHRGTNNRNARSEHGILPAPSGHPVRLSETADYNSAGRTD